MTRIAGLIVATALLAGAPARAALVVAGDSILDTATGLEWLNVRLPNGISYNAIRAGAGGWVAAGWRFATFDEVMSLATGYVGAMNGGYGGLPFSGLSGGYASAAEAFVLTMGMNTAFNDSRAVYDIQQFPGLQQITTQGWFTDRDSADGRVGIFDVTAVLADSIGVYGVPAPLGRWSVEENVEDPDRAAPSVSSMLVRGVSTQVPEPATIWLIGASLALMAWMRRGVGAAVGRDAARAAR
jgi:hypothetical protein